MNENPNDVDRIVRAFADGKLTADRLADELRRCAERPDVGLRAFKTIRIEGVNAVGGAREMPRSASGTDLVPTCSSFQNEVAASPVETGEAMFAD